MERKNKKYAKIMEIISEKTTFLSESQIIAAEFLYAYSRTIRLYDYTSHWTAKPGTFLFFLVLEKSIFMFFTPYRNPLYK
jgi:hypothetical protein